MSRLVDKLQRDLVRRGVAMRYPVCEVHIVRGASGGAVKGQLAVVIAQLGRVVVGLLLGRSVRVRDLD